MLRGNTRAHSTVASARAKEVHFTCTWLVLEAAVFPGSPETVLKHGGRFHCALGLGPRQIETAMRSYPGLRHRCQLIATVDGVRYVNDSKATNVDSAAKALAAFDKIRWICGGLEKDGGLDGLAGATGGVRKAYVIGREAAGFAMLHKDTRLPLEYNKEDLLNPHFIVL